MVDWVAIASLGFSVAALGISIFAIYRANKTTSAATLVSLNEGFRSAWQRFLDADKDSKDYELAELLNLIEIGSAVYLESSLTGNSGQLMFSYLGSSLKLLSADEEVKKRASKLIQSETTFAFTREFLKKMKKQPNSDVPPEWYES